MTPTRPTISVVLVTRDRPGLLRDALRGIAAQILPPLEVIIADDGEQPVPAEILSGAQVPIEVIPVSARLTAAARNRASAAAHGEVLAFHDDDDRWLPHHLAGLAVAFRDPAVELAWRDSAIIQEQVTPEGIRRDLDRRVIAHDWDPALMRHDDYLPPSAWAVRRPLFEKLQGFDESFRFSEDWDFLMRAAAITTPRRVPGVTVEVRMREHGNLSSEVHAERIACLRHLEERHGLPPLEPKTFWEVALAVAAAAGTAPPVSAELVIVGAGPAGVSAALWARSFGITTQVLEAGATAGGQLHHIHHPLLNLAGVADGDAATIARAYKDQLEATGAEVRYGVAATALDPGRPAVRDASGAWIEGRAVLIATGVRRRRLEVPGERELEGRGVSWSATHDRARFAGEEVVVAGGGDAAYENALLLAEVGCPVTLAVRGTPRARSEFRARVAATLRIDVQEHTSVSAVLGEDRVSAVRLSGPHGEFEVPAAGLVVKAGVIPNTEWCAAQVERDAEGYVPVDEQCGTSQPRVWAVGDVTHPPLAGVAVALGQGALAVNAIRSTLRGD